MYTFLLLWTDFSVIKPDIGHLIIFNLPFLIAIVLIFIGLIDIFTKEFKDQMERIFWLLAILLTCGFATLFYLIKRKSLIVKK